MTDSGRCFGGSAAVCMAVSRVPGCATSLCQSSGRYPPPHRILKQQVRHARMGRLVQQSKAAGRASLSAWLRESIGGVGAIRGLTHIRRGCASPCEPSESINRRRSTTSDPRPTHFKPGVRNYQISDERETCDCPNAFGNPDVSRYTETRGASRHNSGLLR